jgi:hypothetical protein
VFLKSKEAANGYEAIKILMRLALPGVVAYKVKKISDSLKRTAEAYHAGRDALVKELGAEDESAPGNFYIPKEKVKEFEAREKEIAELVEEVQDVRPIYLDELEKVEFPGAVYEHLEWCIEKRPKLTP